jgi:hypothetical protein
MCKWFSFVNLGHAYGHLGLGCKKIGNMFLISHAKAWAEFLTFCVCGDVSQITAVIDYNHNHLYGSQKGM